MPRLFLAVLIILTVGSAVAQEAPKPKIEEGDLARFFQVPESVASDQARNWTTVEIVLSVGVMVFALVVLGLESVIILKATEPWPPQSVLRVFGLTLILSLSVLLIAAGYNSEQSAPVFGLLGVIAGYLLGNNNGNPAANGNVPPAPGGP